MTNHTPSEVLKELEVMAANLGAKNCPYMAAVLLQYYDGDCAAETKDDRLQMARKYLDQACAQPPYQPPGTPKTATPKP